MSFSMNVKIELINIEHNENKKHIFQLYGMLIGCKSFSRDLIYIESESLSVINLYINLINDIFDFNIRYKVSCLFESKDIFIIEINNKILIDKIYNFFKSVDEYIIASVFSQKSLKHFSDFIRGIFIACGNISNPSNEYNLEFVITNQKIGKYIEEYIKAKFNNVKSKVRRENYVIYFKDSSSIEDILTCIGAVKSSLEIMNIKIYKNLRNKVNRITNCETSNIEKTVLAATNQIRMIDSIINKKGLDFFPDDLKEIAIKRLKNPDMSLSELSKILYKPMSKSGVSHRLKRIENLFLSLNLSDDDRH